MLHELVRLGLTLTEKPAAESLAVAVQLPAGKSVRKSVTVRSPLQVPPDEPRVFVPLAVVLLPEHAFENAQAYE